MKTSIYIAWRYLLSKSNQSLVNLVSYLSLLVVVMASAALTVVLSAFEGLRDLSVSYAYENSPAFRIKPEGQGVFIVDSIELQKWEKKTGSVVLSQLSVVGLIQKGERVVAGNLVAYRPGRADSVLVSYGSNRFSRGELLLSSNSYYELGGGSYNEMISAGSLVPGERAVRLRLDANEVREKFLTIKGVFLEENEDPILGIADYEDLLYLGGHANGSFTSIDIRESFLSKKEIRCDLKNLIGGAFKIQDRKEQNQSLFKLLNTEYWATYLIFSLVLVLALFSLVGSIRLVMADKSSSFSTFRQIGLTPNEIKNIFLFLGTALSGFGAVIGIGLGIVLVLGQSKFEWIKLSSDLSYPAVLSTSNLTIVLATLLFFGFIASLISSRKLPEVSKVMKS